MNLEQWGFPDLSLTEGEKAVLALGRHHGLSESAIQDSEMVLLTTHRVFYLAHGRGRWQALVADLEDVHALEVGSTGKNAATLVIGIIGLVGGLLGWLLLPDTPIFLPLATAVVGMAGALLLLLFLVLPEQGVLVLQAGTGQIRMEFSVHGASHQTPTLVNQFFALREERWRERHASGASEKAPGAPAPGEIPVAELGGDRLEETKGSTSEAAEGQTLAGAEQASEEHGEGARPQETLS